MIWPRSKARKEVERERFAANEQARAEEVFVGKTIKEVKVVTSDDQLDHMTLTFEDGSWAVIGRDVESDNT